MSIGIFEIVQQGGGEITGKVRLQKTVYLLDQLGFQSGFSFEYHHFGPYSEALTEQVRDEIAFNCLKATPKRRASDGVPYVVYSLPDGGAVADTSAFPTSLRTALERMQATPATVLELAATAHWLSIVEDRADWAVELRKRKGAKLDNGRDEQALDLLRDLGLELK